MSELKIRWVSSHPYYVLYVTYLALLWSIMNLSIPTTILYFYYFLYIDINLVYKCKYIRLSLSRIPRDSLKHFEISVPRHIRFSELRKLFEQPHLTNLYVIGLLTLQTYRKYCGKEEKLLLRSNFSSFPQYFLLVVRFSCLGRDKIFTSR